MKKRAPGWFGLKKGDGKTTHLYREYFFNRYKDPYEPTRIQWKVVDKGFFSFSHLWMWDSHLQDVA